MSEINPALAKPIDGLPADVKARVEAARAAVYGPNAAQATAAQREMVLNWQRNPTSENTTELPAAERAAAPRTAPAAAPAANQEGERNGVQADVMNADRVDETTRPLAERTGELIGTGTGMAAGAVVNGVRAGAHAVAETARDPRGTAEGAAESVGNGVERFTSNLNPGSITGGLLGAGGAYVVSSIFGSGPLKWVFMALLLPLGAILGATKLDGPINQFFSGLFGSRNRETGDTARPREAQPGVPQPAVQPQQPALQAEQPAQTATVAAGQMPAVAPSAQAPWTPSFTVTPEMGYVPLQREDFRSVSGVHSAVPPSTGRLQYSEAEQVYLGGQHAYAGANGLDTGRNVEGARVQMRGNGSVNVYTGTGLAIHQDHRGRVSLNPVR